ncbi:bacteriochlorophyll 4-vinyl reductase [Thiobaca trueperi]|uniref:Divinyl protochlorophyllide a 8-vinyl-reductase n=1 Tax=Thiobaca trueperi TaxID=127458 RepID=A0A4R3MV64_9GAMM|nr:bacteriochlorophyll 4-vinyl reductase [Thiobaca trueperi]TCT18208.1 divinyl protochlorophyllide a 8-vinyl-reductase [Thiobaca trueperi]
MIRSEHHGRVGPNAIIRVAEALEARQDRAAVIDLFRLAGLEGYLDALPTAMVDEQEVTALQAALRQQLGITAAREVARDAGLRTGDYLLANRIPRPAQTLLSILPPRLASRALLKAIRGNAWTFVGTGIFEANPSHPPRLTVTDSLLCRGASATEPLCDFYAGTFERLFRRLVHPDSLVTEIACHATGAPACIFEVRWS